MPNQLAASTSPYLRQHADNPVDWREWSDEALAEAAERDIPILLSVGYATCHWCHVMAHESFEDDETAAFMNTHFVAVKVDREERPDIDRIYMDAVTAMTGRGGWPMTVFLTPDARPIYAGTYYPKQRMGGHPSFREVMAAVVDAWDANREGILAQADQITAAITHGPPTSGRVPDLDDLDRAVLEVEAGFDRVNGGFGTAPKFPQAPTLEFLLRMAALRPGTRSAELSLEMATSMLSAMASGGIYDHLLGGFARYSVDAQWLIPHFEKMLYDNAQLARVYARAWQLTRIDRFRDVAIEILDYLDGTMADESGGIHSAEDADSEGVEGKFAVWTWDELASILSDDLELASAIYGATPAGNFEGANNLHRYRSLDDVADDLGMSVGDVVARKRAIDTTLRRARTERTPPGRDDKIVTAWNGLAIRAFVEGGMIFGENRYLERARSIASFLLDDASPDGQLVRSWRDGPGHTAFADDHAAVAVGLYSLYAATGEERWFEAAEHHTGVLRTKFADPSGGFFATREGSGLITRPKNIQDNPTPSDNALAMEALLTHAAYTGDLEAVGQAEATMEAVAPVALHHPSFGGYSLAIWLTHLIGIEEVAIVGDEATELTHVVWSEFRPHVALAVGAGAATSVPLLAERPIGDRPVAYVCKNQVCDLPTGSASELASQLALRS
ncbi:MAG: thioredoxin domain-containing protein [Acidimicrobiia bacterium]|nr:thioredoxin domain-containing protein [Acidimicrobiia bacterium]